MNGTHATMTAPATILATILATALAATLALMLPASPVLAQHEAPSTAERVALAAFTAAERELIRSYFSEHGLPPAGHGKGPHGQGGKGGKGAKGLPPGIAKNLQRGKPLPPGIRKRGLPPGLSKRLPAREGYQYIYIDGRVLLVEAGTHIVHDTLSDLLL